MIIKILNELNTTEKCIVIKVLSCKIQNDRYIINNSNKNNKKKAFKWMNFPKNTLPARLIKLAILIGKMSICTSFIKSRVNWRMYSPCLAFSFLVGCMLFEIDVHKFENFCWNSIVKENFCLLKLNFHKVFLTAPFKTSLTEYFCKKTIAFYQVLHLKVWRKIFR